MHPMFFSIKRTHLGVLARTRPIAERFELTPARFDMMRAIALYDEWGMPQCKLVRLLGVSAAVVSRMLKQLTELGFVRRHRDPTDRRYNIIHLEPAGAARVRGLIVEHVYDRDLDCIAFEVFAPPERWNLDDLYKRLNRARRLLHDRAPFLHPWRLADVVDENFQFRRLRDDDVDVSIPREDLLNDRFDRLPPLERSAARFRPTHSQRYGPGPPPGAQPRP